MARENTGYQSFLSQGQFCLLSVLLCVLITWFCSPQVAAPNSRLDRKVSCTPLAASAPVTVASSQGECLLWLSLAAALDLGRVVCFAPSLGIPVVFKGLFNTTKNMYPSSRLKPDKIFERSPPSPPPRHLFLLLTGISVVRSWLNWKLVYRA